MWDLRHYSYSPWISRVETSSWIKFLFIYFVNEFAREMNSYPLDKPTFTWWRSFQTKSFQRSASMSWTQLNDGVATARFKGLIKLDRIYSSVLQWTLCYVRTAPEVSVEEGKHASRFFRKFLRKFISCVLLLVTSPG